MTVGSSSKPENATKSNSTADMIGKLSLPPEWGQSVNSASGAPKEDSKASHDASATSMGKDMVSTEETMQNILDQHAKVATGVTPTQCVDTKTAETAEEKEATRAKQVQPDTTNESTNTNFVEEEQPEVNQPEDSPAGCDGQRSSEYAEAVSAAKKNQTQQRAGREEGGRGRSPTVRSRRMDKTKKDLQADIEKSSQDASHRMSTRGRKGSLSLKRKAAAHWTADHTHDMLEELIGTAQIPRQHRTARSLSPKRRTTEATRRGEKMTMQKFMTDITDHIEYDEEKTAKEATQVLKAVRKAAKAAIQTAESVQGEYRHEFERGTGNRKSIGTEVRELIATCDEPSQQAEIRSLQVLPGQQIVKESTPSSREVASTAIEVRNSESTSLIVVTGDHDDETGGSSKALPEISTKIMEKVPVGMKKGMAEAPCQSAQAQGRVDSQ
ncbi:hypothetical protein PR002_g12724 [Phytophthora rubi]|uniref:Uncharacterized protein n=1 Tax=Phytophthora rubi TaxID=129364 RepID=A0A6A3LTZ2_9STRA|nr:hypothetical protein PR002_g12724 [Phytophthora rubi]